MPKQKRAAKRSANPRAKASSTKKPPNRVEPPAVDGQRWVRLTQLYQETGVPVRTLNEILRTDPGVLVVRTNGAHIEYEQPTCAIRLRERAVRIAVENVKGNGPNASIARQQAEADLKKAQHAAGIEEMKEAEMKKQLVRADEMRAGFSELLAALSAAIDIFPAQNANDILGITNEAEGLIALQRVARELRSALRTVKMPELPDDPQPAVAT